MRFAPCGPLRDPEQVFADPAVMSTRWMRLESVHALMKQAVGPNLRDDFTTLTSEARTHDVLVSHHFVFAARALHEATGIAWVSTFLAPGAMPSSSYLPHPLLPTERLGPRARPLHRAVWTAGRYTTRAVVDPTINAFRREVGLPPGADHFFTGAISERLHLLLYSRALIEPDPTWPAHIQQSGFVLHDELTDYEPPPRLVEFLARGDRPWLFTLGTAAVASPGDFFRAAVEAARLAGSRLVLLTGNNRMRIDSPTVFAHSYVPFAWIMPRCRAVAHQCGAGTTAQVLRAGLPSVAVPHAFDQPSTARLLARLGVAAIVPPSRLDPQRLAEAMVRLDRADVARRAKALGESIVAEDGARAAADQLERAFDQRALASAEMRARQN